MVSSLKRSERRAALFFLTPWLLGVVAITAGPLILSAYFSLTRYSILSTPQWIGLQNYTDAFADPRFLTSLKVTFTYAFVGVPAQLAFALGVALLMNRAFRGTRLYRSIYYLPSMLGGSVAVSLLWRQMFGVSGVVNSILGSFGVDGPGWLTDPDIAIFTLILLHVWTFGSPMVIFAAGLKQVPTEYYEAARVDGAGPLRQFVNITIPILTPIVFFNAVIQLIGAFQSFTQARILTDGNGGPVDSTLLIALYLYQQAFTLFNMGYASALAWILVVIIGTLSALLFASQRYWVFYND